MPTNPLGPGVSRYTDNRDKQLAGVIFQARRPPLDSELNLISLIELEARAETVRAEMASGWLMNEANPRSDFFTDPQNSNLFYFGRNTPGETRNITWAAVNGWLIPVTGTRTGAPPLAANDVDSWNKILLNPPTSSTGGNRSEFVFLEVWLARIEVDPAPPNAAPGKPIRGFIYKFGNVEGGFSYLHDDLVDPDLNAATTKRIQIQYRIRVVTDIGISQYPEGFDPSLVFAQGMLQVPSAIPFQNMRQELGDPGLWRSGTGDPSTFGTVDGYVYAIPLCAVFRRNSAGFSDVGNVAGAFNRNSKAQTRNNATKYIAGVNLLADIASTDTQFTLTSITGTSLATMNSFAEAYFKIDDEVIRVANIIAVSPTQFTIIIERGQVQTTVRSHLTGAALVPYTVRPDGLYSDQIAATDILDLRHSVASKFDYDSILKTNFMELLKGNLRTAWKRYGSTNSSGPVILYGDRVTDSTIFVGGLTRLDAPDGNRRVYSDAVTVQRFNVPVTVPTNSVPLNNPQQKSIAPYDISVLWTGNPPTHGPSQRLYTTMAGSYPAWWNGDRITVLVQNFRKGLPGSDTDQVRFVSPSEDQDAVLIRFEGMTYDPNGGTSDLSLDPTVSNPNLSVSPPSGTLPILKHNQGINVSFDANGNMVILFQSGAVDTVLNEFVYAMQASVDSTYASKLSMHIEFAVVYGGGRGLSHKPDYIHAAQYRGSPTNSSKVMLRGGLSDRSRMIPTYLGDSPYVQTGNNRNLAKTSEVMIDPGSKTLYVAPYRSLVLPALLCRDGSILNWFLSGTAATITVVGPTVTVTGLTGMYPGLVGVSLNISNSSQLTNNGSWVIASYISPTSVVITNGAAVTDTGNDVWSVAQGAMPLLSQDGSSIVHPVVDPLDLFMNGLETRYVDIPLEYLPKQGLHHIPIQPVSNTVFPSGINFLMMSLEGPNQTTSGYNQDFVAYPSASPGFYIANARVGETYGQAAGSITVFGEKYSNSALTSSTGGVFKGIRFPPFLAPARITGIYVRAPGVGAGSYTPVSSPFNNDRIFTGLVGSNVNLMRDSYDGPSVLLDVDVNGDMTFVMSADIIDFAKAPTGTTFDNTDFLIECTLFGFDRGFLQTNGRLCITKLSGGAGSLAIESFTDDVTTGHESNGVGLISPAPLSADASNNELTVYYSRAPYQGDVFGTQSAYSDDLYRLGPLTPGEATGIAASPLVPVASLTMPNKTGFEVLASTSFVTSLGTGRLSGSVPLPLLNDFEAPNNPPDYQGSPVDLWRRFSVNRVGYEDWSTPKFPVNPASLATRPPLALHGLSERYDNDVHQEFAGCTVNLPLGIYFRDKDFCGKTLWQQRSFSNVGASSMGTLSNVNYESSTNQGAAGASTWEGTEFICGNTSGSAGVGMESIVKVDGTQNPTDTAIFKTTRGGAAYSTTGPWPGGVISSRFQKARPNSEVGSVLLANAYLVRSQPESVGMAEIHMGSELQMVVVTQAVPAYFRDTEIAHSASGANEGFTAADRFRLLGRPLEKRRGFVDTSIQPSEKPVFVNKIYDDPLFYGSGDVPLLSQVQETLLVTSNGQTDFTLSKRPLDPTAVQFFLNGVKITYGTSCTIGGPTNQNLVYIPDPPLFDPVVLGDLLELFYLTF
jgi:hypothetical protein